MTRGANIGHDREMSRRRAPLIAAILAVVLGVVAVTGATLSAAAVHASGASASTITLQIPKRYTPKGTNGGTDDYRCFLLPTPASVTSDQVITGVNVKPDNKPIVHHAILYLIPATSVPAAVALSGKDGRQGWSCFGDVGLPIAGGPAGLFNYQQNAPWLAAWAPGAKAQTFPAGTGMKWPVGARLVLQMHYNLLAGRGTDQTKVVVNAVPDDGSLTALHTMLLLAPVELACPKGVKGKLCNRTASVAEMVKRSNSDAGFLATDLNYLCNDRKIHPRLTTTCTWPTQQSITIWAVAPHMHLLGKSLSVDVGVNTNSPTRLLTVKTWNFDDQEAVKLAQPLTVTAGTGLRITCTHNPKLRQLLPALRKLPPRYVTWGDGSSDEMCLSMIIYSLPPVPSPTPSATATP